MVGSSIVRQIVKYCSTSVAQVSCPIRAKFSTPSSLTVRAQRPWRIKAFYKTVNADGLLFDHGIPLAGCRIKQ